MANADNEQIIIKAGFSDVVRQSFIDYSMSVIQDRALPDVRDGCKPVHRRIIYTMFNEGLFSNKQYKKSASVVGTTLGSWHPHGKL